MQSIDDFRNHITQITKDDFVFDRLHQLVGREEMVLFQFTKRPPTDEIIIDFIANSFGIWGGGSMENPKGWYEYKGGKHPHLIFTDLSHAERAKLHGSRLIAAFRTLYGIPAGGQMPLF